jgi:hypothetical protein
MSQSLVLTKLNTVEDLARVGDVFVRSGFFADTRDAAQAIVKVMAGQELGFAPIASMTGVYIVKGKVSLSANLIAAAVKRSGRYTFRVRQHDAQICEIEFFELDKAGNKESIGVSSFTMKEAREGGINMDWDKHSNGWKEKATWKNFPRNMLYARAMSNGAKWYCPDVFGGPVYTPDELGATIDGETGEVIDIEPTAPAATIAAPAAIVPPATAEQIEALTLIVNGLRDYDVKDTDLTAALTRLTGNTNVTVDPASWSVLNHTQIEAAIYRLTQRLEKFDEDSAVAAREADVVVEADETGPTF